MPDFHILRALILAVALSACGGPPETIVDPPVPPGEFVWQSGFTDLDEAVLSTCGHNGEFLAVGGDQQAAVLEWLDGEWRVAPMPAGAGVLWWCWIDSAGAAWAVGEEGTVLTRTAGQWNLRDTLGAISSEITLYGVWGAAPDNVYVVGGSLTNSTLPVAIGHYDGTQWTPIATDGLPAQPLFKIWGLSADDIWAVGAGGTALHYDGAAWTATDTGSAARLTAVWGTATDNVYAVGGQGTGIVLRWDGTAWSTFASAGEELAGVWTAPGLPLYAGGNRGLLIRYDLSPDNLPSAELATVVAPTADLDVHALFGTGDGTQPDDRRIVVAAATDLLGGAATGWRGAVLTHGQPSLSGPVVRPVVPDAGVPPDAGLDAGPIDAGPTGPGPGELCGELPNICAPELECWLVISSGNYLCTQPCADASECTAYGPGACCERPGFQTLETVCLGPEIDECQPK